MMASLFQILGALLALVASGHALSCMHCFSNTESCIGLSVPCSSGFKCGATLYSNEKGGVAIKLYMKSCMPQDQCGLNGSATIVFGVKMRMGISCCSSHLCTPTVPTLPRVSLVSNGLTCRSCISADYTWCTGTIQCTGDENMCLLQTSKLSGIMSASTAIRGCATKSLCDLGSLFYNTKVLTADIKFICTKEREDL
ncbi:phospholipase A2 inhibitor NAI-like [Mantella aurantiaca]